MKPQSPRYVVVFVLVLSLAQLAALAMQFKKGFRLFQKEPVRVALSWDMFANRVERCVLACEPAVPAGPFRLTSLRELGTHLEWDVVYDHVADYRTVGRFICRDGDKPLNIKLRCFLPNGTEHLETLNAQ